MNFDHASMPFEIWCDSLEDEGLTTEDLRLLFEYDNGGKHGQAEAAKFGEGHCYLFGSGLGHGYGFTNGYGFGGEGITTHTRGDGNYYGYNADL